MFSRFYRLPALGLPFCARLGERKYRSGARMISFPNQAPERGRLAANNEAIQDLCRLKAEKLSCRFVRTGIRPALKKKRGTGL